MKLNVACPSTGAQKLFEIDDERKVRILYEKRMGQTVEMGSIGDEWRGYVCKITGGNDKQGFPMKQGVLTTNRVRLLMKKGHSCYRPRRKGERKRKSVRGCIVDASMSVVSLVMLKKGDNDIPGLTDVSVPRRLGPKRANKIRKLFNLSKQDDVRQYVLKRPVPPKEGKENSKPRFKSPKIQRLITPQRLQRKRHRASLKKKRVETRNVKAAEYARLVTLLAKESSEKKKEIRRRRSSMRDSVASQEKKPDTKVAATVKSTTKAAVKPTGKSALPAVKSAAVSKPAAKATAVKASAKPASQVKPAASKPTTVKPAAVKPVTSKTAAKPVAKSSKATAKGKKGSK